MKQTAVEWLVEQICGDHTSEWQEQIDQAKEMEKEQIKEAWLNSLTKGDFNSAEQYYTETYESKTNL
jgi:uncharacterized Zn ribbon protein